MAISKKNNKTWPLLAGAIGFGVIAALLAMLYLKSREAAILESLKGPEVRNLTVVVAKQNLPKGTIIAQGIFATRSVPENFVHEDAVFPGDFERYQGQALIANLGRGKTLLKSFIDADFPVDFSDIIPAGSRAMTITVDEVNSIGGHLRPGNRIDLYVNIPYSESGFNARAITAGLVDVSSLPPEITNVVPVELLAQAAGSDVADEIIALATPSDVILPVVQNIRVLATGSDAYQETLDQLHQPQQRREGHFGNITVAVTPEQAALITLALDKGEILSLLRNRKDENFSEFTTMAARDLFTNASQMAATQQERASRAAVAAGVNINGNLVDAEGNTLLSRDQLAAAGYTVNDKGQIIDKDGNVVDPADIVVTKNGTVMTKQQLAAAGLTVNENGQIIDKNGNIVDANDVIVAADGSVVTKAQLQASGLTVNENGEIVDSEGRVVSANDIIVTKDGKVINKQQLADAGLTVNENGEIVDANGNVVDPDSLIVAADGSILSREQLAAAGLSVNEKGEIVDSAGNVVDPTDLVVASDGTVMSKQQLAAAGLSINEKGQVVDKNGKVVDSDDLVTAPDGTVMSKRQLAAAGLSVNENGEIVDASGRVVSSEELAKVAKSIPITGTGGAAGSYDFIIGGASKDGVPKVQKLPLKE